MLPGSGRPGDTRNFVHKKLLGFAKGAIGGFIGGGPLGALKGGIKGVVGAGDKSPVPGRLITETLGRKLGGRGVIGAAKGDCFLGFVKDPVTGRCVLATSVTAGGFGPGGPKPTIAFEFGDAVMGQFGAGLEPATRSMETRVCPRGTVLGVDGICYNRRDIKNNERAWPRGRRPLLTGGEMRCISVAASAAKKLATKQKQLQTLGMLPKPAVRRKQKALPSGHHAHVGHD